MLRWSEAPLCGAQNHGRIFLSLSFPHPVDSRQSVRQPASCSLDGARSRRRRQRRAMPLSRSLVVKFSCCFDDVFLLPRSISILEQD